MFSSFAAAAAPWAIRLRSPGRNCAAKPADFQEFTSQNHGVLLCQSLFGITPCRERTSPRECCLRLRPFIFRLPCMSNPPNDKIAARSHGRRRVKNLRTSSRVRMPLPSASILRKIRGRANSSGVSLPSLLVSSALNCLWTCAGPRLAFGFKSWRRSGSPCSSALPF